jgi:hypothetical protein
MTVGGGDIDRSLSPGVAPPATEAGNIAALGQGVPPPRGVLAPAALRILARRSDLRGALQFGAHAGCLSATAVLVWLARPYWYLLVPAMALHGVAIVTMFAPMHECVHRTAFASRATNDCVGWIAGVASFYNATFYRHYHAWHHRYTQDPARDPELIYPKAENRRQYVKEMTGINFWLRRAIDYPSLALGGARGLPFVPAAARRRIQLSMSLQLLIYLAGVVSIALGFRAVLYYWFLPAVLAQPFAARLADRRAYRLQPRPRWPRQHAHDLDPVPDPLIDVEHAVPRRASFVSGGPVSPTAGAAPPDPRQTGQYRAELPGSEPRRHPLPAMTASGNSFFTGRCRSSRTCAEPSGGIPLR